MFISSVVGLASLSPIAPYASTKHAVEAVAEAMQGEVAPFGIQVQTINPGAHFTGFNETMVEGAFRWMNDDVNFTTRAQVQAIADGPLKAPSGALNPDDMVAEMVKIIPAREGLFRNVHPPLWKQMMLDHQAQMRSQKV